MLKRIFTYTDFLGNERTEEAFFNLTESEITEMSLAPQGGFDAMIKRIIEAHDGKQIMETFRAIILKAYGKKSEDGRRFIKSKEISEEFSQTPMFNKLYMEIVFDAEKAAEFVSKIMPSSKSTIAAKARENIAKMNEKKTAKLIPEDFYAPIKTDGYTEETMGDSANVTLVDHTPEMVSVPDVRVVPVEKETAPVSLQATLAEMSSSNPEVRPYDSPAY